MGNQPCSIDLRDSACFPYLPVENQRDEVTCVSHAFAMALYCTSQKTFYPDLKACYRECLKSSPDPERGITFPALKKALHQFYANEMKGLKFSQLRNNSRSIMRTLQMQTPVIVGYQVNSEIEKFHQDTTPYNHIMPISTDSPLYGHCVLIVGYDIGIGCFIARNSWGKHWGIDGHFLIPYQCINDKNSCTDLWAFIKR